jgi:hypothetical protein
MKDKVTGPFFFCGTFNKWQNLSYNVKEHCLFHTPTGTRVQIGLCTTSLLPLPFCERNF